MSYRLHVVGALDCSAEEFQAALGSIGQEEDDQPCRAFRFGSSGRWQWAHASVWSVGGLEIDQALQTLDVPGIRVTSSDAILWMIALTKVNAEIFRGVHYFDQVGSTEPEVIAREQEPPDPDFPADELDSVAGINKFIPELSFLWDEAEEQRLLKEYAEEEEQSDPALEEYTDYGVHFPPEVAERIREIYKASAEKAGWAAFREHNTQIVAALEQYGLPIERESLLVYLNDGPMTALESGSDLGNMLGFLKRLGIEGLTAEEAENEEVAEVDYDEDDEEEEIPDWSDCEPGEFFEEAVAIRDEHSLIAFSGEPLILSLEQTAFLHLLAEFCQSHQPALVELTFPDDSEVPAMVWQDLGDVEATHQDNVWTLCFEPRLWWMTVCEPDDMRDHEFVLCLKTLPDETRLDITFLVPELAEECQRYAGVVRGGHFELQKTCPELSSALLRETLELLSNLASERPIEITPEEEPVLREVLSEQQQSVARIRNGKIQPEFGDRQVVLHELFFLRYSKRGPWDLKSARREQLDEDEEFEDLVNDFSDTDSEEDDESETNEAAQKLIDMMRQYEQAKIVPHSEEIIHDGKSGKVYRASLSDLDSVTPDQVAADDTAMRKIGLLPVADVAGEVDQLQSITRCYGGGETALAVVSHRKEGNTHGWLHEDSSSTLLDFSGGIREFHTHFADGSILVTSNSEGATSLLDQKIYIRIYEGFSPDRLWEKHADGIARFEEHKDVQSIDHSGSSDPARFAKLMNELFCRIQAVMQRGAE